MENKNDFLGTEPVGRLMVRLAVPTILAQIINMLYNIVDRIYIGHMPERGSLALAGVGVCMPIIMIVTAFSSFMSIGGAPRASIFMGSREKDMAERTMGECLLLQIIVSAVLTALLLLWNRELLLLFGASENTIKYAADYMNIYALGTLFVQLTLGLNSFITAQGFAKVSMGTVLIGAVLNIVLDYVLIFEMNMGVRGAALATIISQGVSCLWVVVFLCGKRTLLRIKPEYLRLEKEILLPCIGLGMSQFTISSSESVLSVCFNSSLLKYGGDLAVGAMTILYSVMHFAMLPLQSLGQGAQPIISYNYGAGNADRMRSTFRLLMKASLVYSALLWAAVHAVPRAFAGMFTDSEELILYTMKAMHIYFAVLLIFGIQMACQMTLISIGSAKASMVVAIFRKFILLIPLIYIMPALFPEDKAMAVYAAEPVADVAAVLFTSILFGYQLKKVLNNAEHGVSL